jgi:hypothetical protein
VIRQWPIGARVLRRLAELRCDERDIRRSAFLNR